MKKGSMLLCSLIVILSFFTISFVNATGSIPDVPIPSQLPSFASYDYEFNVETTFNPPNLVENQMMTAKVTATNVSSMKYEEKKDVLVIVGLYDSNSTMVNVSYISKGIPYLGTEVLSAGFKLPSNVKGYIVKAFMWDGTDIKTSNMIPLSNVNSIPSAPTTPTIVPTPTTKPAPTPTIRPTSTPTIETTPMKGNVTYTLQRVSNPTSDQEDAYNRIKSAMDEAVLYYNTYTAISKRLTITYNTGVSTADGNINGSIRFGSNRSYMNRITAMHEIAHTVGVGTSSQWQKLVANGTYTGSNAIEQLRAITGDKNSVLHGDTQHFWPYGLNYTSEVKSDADLVNHCKIVNAMKKDGL